MPDDRPLADLAHRERAMNSTLARLRAVRPRRATTLGLGDLAGMLTRAFRRRDVRIAGVTIACLSLAALIVGASRRRD